MANTIRIRRSATSGAVPTTSQLSLGELAINTYDGKLFLKKNDGSASIVEVGNNGSAAVSKIFLYEKGNTGNADSFDGSETRFQLRDENGSVINDITSAYQLLISIDGVVQEAHSSSAGTDGFYITSNTASGTDIVFLDAPSSGAEFFGTAGVIERGGPPAPIDGTFTPFYSSGFDSTVYNGQHGYYYKYGKFVHFSLRINFGSMQAYRSNSDPIKIGGLPFTSNSGSEYMGGCVICKDNYGSFFDNIHVAIEPNTTEIVFYDNFTSLAGDQTSHNFKFIVISGNYMTS